MHLLPAWTNEQRKRNEREYGHTEGERQRSAESEIEETLHQNLVVAHRELKLQLVRLLLERSGHRWDQRRLAADLPLEHRVTLRERSNARCVHRRIGQERVSRPFSRRDSRLRMRCEHIGLQRQTRAERVLRRCAADVLHLPLVFLLVVVQLHCGHDAAG